MVLIWSGWFQHGSHSPNWTLAPASLLFHPSLSFPTSHLSVAPPPPTTTPPLCLHHLSNSLIVERVSSWADLGFHTWECVSAKEGQENFSFPRIYSTALSQGDDAEMYEGGRGMKKPCSPRNAGRGIEICMPRLRQSLVLRWMLHQSAASAHNR